MKLAPTLILALLALSSPAIAVPALNYRGPINEAPQGLYAPGQEGMIGSERLQSKSLRVEGDARWEFWWEMNRDRYLRLAAASNERARPDSGGDTFYSAEPGREPQVSPLDSSERIRPLLLRLLSSGDREQRQIAAVALGLAGEKSAMKALLRMVGGSSSPDRRAGALGLGFLGDPLAVPALEAQLLGAGVSLADRARMALALGFVGGRDAEAVLQRALVESLKLRGSEAVDLQASIAAGLGLAGGKRSIGALVRVANARENRAVELRTAAINSLGRIGDESAVPALTGLLTDSKALVRNAAVQALGMIGSDQARAALVAAFNDDGDPAVRSQAAIALARIGGTGVADLLVGGIDIRNPRVLREFSALALGILGDGTRAASIRPLLTGRSGEGLAGATAIALGMLRDSTAVPALRSLARNESRDANVRGYALMALAMLGDPVTRSQIPDLARRPGPAQIRRGGTLAVGLYPRLTASRTILASLFEEGDPYVRGAAMLSLGGVPRAGVADMLLGIVESRGFSAEARLDALLALGVLARRGALSRAEELTRDLNYQSMVPAVAEVSEMF